MSNSIQQFNQTIYNDIQSGKPNTMTNIKHSPKVIKQLINNVENVHIITLKVLPATDTKQTRIKLVSHRFNQSIIMPFDHKYSQYSDHAKAYLIENGFNLVFEGLTDHHVFGVKTQDSKGRFKPLKDIK